MAPPDEEDAKDLQLAAGYARGFLVHMCALLRKGARKAERAMWGLGPSFQMTLFARFGRGAVLLNRRAVRQPLAPLPPPFQPPLAVPAQWPPLPAPAVHAAVAAGVFA